ncbi:MAG: ribosomal protection-like ABC-F family protein, partial [Candidatus Promineifilaceae bacterium]
MSILSAHDLSLSFGAVDLFSRLALAVPAGAKIGLVGPNGIGKTSLLLILAGLSQPTAGSVQRARGLRLAYLPQEASDAFSGRQQTVQAEMKAVFAPLRQAEQALRQMEAQLAAGDDSPELLARYGAALEAFEAAGGYDYETRIAQVLQGLGFSAAERDQPVSQLSGGQKTRALLARLLLERPDLLILDEPTNHLDVQAIEWLESALRLWDGALLLVGHDRYFLDKVVTAIWELTPAGLAAYRGNYSAYLRQRQERFERNQALFQAEKERLEKEIDYIRRHIAGQRTQLAKGKLSRLSRQLDAIQRGGWQAVQGKGWAELSAELDTSRHSLSVAEAAEAIKGLRPPAGRPPGFQLRLRSGRRSGQLVLRAKDLLVGFPGRRLFAAEAVALQRGECAALVGPNGSGKTTFLRTILGQLEPLAGEITLGAGLQLGYFAQAHDRLNPDNRVLDELLRHHDLPIGEARGLLARYLFPADDVYKQVGLLSGGERGRLALAILALEGANFLLLDEPTNHLDIPAQEMLQEVLANFDGTVLLVSHDRYLVAALADQIWHLDERRLRVFKGPYPEYVAAREREGEAGRQPAAASRARQP